MSSLQLFWSFATEWILKNPKGSPFQIVSPLGDFLKKKLFFHKGSPIHQYFDTLRSVCYFYALDVAPTWAGPGLFSLPELFPRLFMLSWRSLMAFNFLRRRNQNFIRGSFKIFLCESFAAKFLLIFFGKFDQFRKCL